MLTEQSSLMGGEIDNRNLWQLDNNVKERGWAI